MLTMESFFLCCFDSFMISFTCIVPDSFLCDCDNVGCTNVQKRGVRSVVEWAEGRGFEFESEEK